MNRLIMLVNADGSHESGLVERETLRKMLAVQDHDSPCEPDGFNGIGWFN